MSDVVYEWRIKPFVESLSEFLYFDMDHQRLYCRTDRKDAEGKKYSQVSHIEVIRSDSNPASNYVVCSRICQQLQIADLVVVDVSNQNANVFYEFGMAVALGKMILPICYSESFYKMVIPDKIENQYKAKKLPDEIEHHIDLFPWRKALFEYYGIIYQNKDSKTRYANFDNAVKWEYGFSDSKYKHFPYHEKVSDETGTENKDIIVGQEIYDRLSKEYNRELDEEDKGKRGSQNTLVVYTMDAFLNKEQAGRCIVNFYHNITSRMEQEKCFRGERVGVLVQENAIIENEKDAKEHIDIFYNIGEIIQIGTNQATYVAAEEKIKSEDDLSASEDANEEGMTKQRKIQRKMQMRDIDRFVKEHSRNRAMRIHPNNPVFVDRMKNLLHKDILESGKVENEKVCRCCNLDSFCLYHVMLRTLRYTNEIVVDISDNCLQSLFWLGAAHGSDIYAITVMHEKNGFEEKIIEQKSTEKKNVDTINVKKEHNRSVFDVSGLWMAILRKNDTKGFYKQLELAQMGIEQHSKLMLPDNKFYKEKMKEYLFANSKVQSENDEQEFTPENLRFQKREEEKEKLESYYRERFWKPMLSYNQLCIYLSQMNEKGSEDKEPRLCMSKWDFDAVAVFSNYLSKRKMIGEYFLLSLPSNRTVENLKPNPDKINFICVGSEVYPLEISLPEQINGKISKQLPEEYAEISGINVIHQKWDDSKETLNDKECINRVFKGFECIGNKGKGIFTQQPKTQRCIECPRQDAASAQIEYNAKEQIIYSGNERVGRDCKLVKEGKHCEIAQLILWKEEAENPYDRDYFRVGISGSSGPATYALSTLFVPKEQRNFEGQNECDFLLYDLQCVVRKKIMKLFLTKLEKELKKIDPVFWKAYGRKDEGVEERQKNRYYTLVKYAVSDYLNTVFYRYFFPFLTEKDIDRICNGIYMFVNSMKAARLSPFALDFHYSRESEYRSYVSNGSIKEIVNKIPEVLHTVLTSFRGLEAFYEVTVHHCLKENAEREDTRKVVSIKRLNDENNFSSVNYLFIFKENE